MCKIDYLNVDVDTNRRRREARPLMQTADSQAAFILFLLRGNFGEQCSSPDFCTAKIVELRSSREAEKVCSRQRSVFRTAPLHFSD
jgi:hypothetical protein